MPWGVPQLGVSGLQPNSKHGSPKRSVGEGDAASTRGGNPRWPDGGRAQSQAHLAGADSLGNQGRPVGRARGALMSQARGGDPQCESPGRKPHLGRGVLFVGGGTGRRPAQAGGGKGRRHSKGQRPPPARRKNFPGAAGLMGSSCGCRSSPIPGIAPHPTPRGHRGAPTPPGMGAGPGTKPGPRPAKCKRPAGRLTLTPGPPGVGLRGLHPSHLTRTPESCRSLRGPRPRKSRPCPLADGLGRTLDENPQ